MERDKQNTRDHEELLSDLVRVFGEDGVAKLTTQIAHDDPSLSHYDVIEQAWSLIGMASAYMLPASQQDLTESAIDVHEGYEAYRRIRD